MLVSVDARIDASIDVSIDASVDASINASIKKYRALFFRAAIKVMNRKFLMRKSLMSKYRYAA